MADPKNGTAQTGDWTRDKLAWAIFIGATAGIVIISITVLFFDKTYAGQVFTALVPLFGTWVGTVLAFYFSRENFESASSSLRNVVDRLTPEQRLRQTSVRDAMIPRTSIKRIELTAQKDEGAVTLGEICETLDLDGVTRAPVFALDMSINYIIHESMVYKFISEKALAGTPVIPKDVKLTEFLDHKDTRTVVRKIAFVAIDRTLAEARDRMVTVSGCQDVIVTETGKASEPVEGWITNVDLTKYGQMQ